MTITPPISNKRSHDNYIAIAKAIGIICVVIWHSRPPQWLGMLTMFFAVPLFFFTSGYFYKPANDFKELKTFYWKRIKGLYFPFVKWSLLFLLLHNICFHFNIYNDQYGFRGEVSHLYSITEFMKHAINIVCTMRDNEQLLGAFWFIRALFLGALLVATVQFFFRRWGFINRYIMFFVLLFASIVATHFNISIPVIGSIGLILFSATFYVAGYCYRKIENEWCYSKLSLFITTLVTFAGLVYFNRVVGVLGIHTADILPYSIVGLCGIVMVLNLSKRIELHSIRSLLYYIGNNTMIILSLHFISFKLVSLIKIGLYGWPIERLAEFPVIEQNNVFWWFLYCMIGLATPLLIQYGYDNTKKLLCNK